MKTKNLLLCISLVLIFGHQVMGQGYIPLVDTNKQWYVVEHFSEGGSGGISRTYILHLGNDTIINTKTYKTVKRSFYPYTVVEIIGVIREDTLNKKVYSIPHPWLPFEEKLLYDFSANAGDTVNIFTNLYSHDEEQFVVLSIDTIMLLNNETRRVWNLESPCPFPDPLSELRWIEGIGSIRGLLFSGCLDFFSFNSTVSVLLCYYEDSTHLYLNNRFDSCYYYYHSDIEENYDKGVAFFPNPVKKEIEIVLNGYFASLNTVKIIDVLGKVVINQKLFGIKHKLDLSNLRTGMYFLIIQNQSELHVIKKKIIKL